MKLIVGLGNPEGKYSGTRHNLGFDVLDELTKKLNLVDWVMESKFKAEVIKTPNLILAKPQTYVNKSGLSVAALANFYKIKPEDIVIIHDELDLPLGHIKIRLGGAAAGHHGVESIMDSLGTDKFIRLRLGIGNLRSQSGERGGQTFGAEKYVLESFMPNEKSDVKKMIKQAIKALDTLMTKGLEKAQSQFNA